MPVELEVETATAHWRRHVSHGEVARAKRAARAVRPRTSVVTTSERTFVIRDHDGRAEWVDVKKGPVEGDLMQVAGDLRPGDKVVRRGTDELHEGAAIGGRPPPPG